MSCPVEYTCPKINEVKEAVQKIKSIASKLQDYEGQSIAELKDAFSEIDSELYGIDSTIEEIRQANAEIREWGEAQEARACDAELLIIGE